MIGIRYLCGAAVLFSGTAALAQSGQWTLSEASGRVAIRDAAGDHAGQRGSVVPAGATLMTGPGARAVAVRGEDFVTVAANSRLRVPEAAQAAGLFQMIEEWGSAVFKVKHLPQPHFAVQTPYLAAVVKGTTFSVTVTREGASLQVIDGAVEVATIDGGAHEMVRPGVIAQVSAADRFRLAVQGQTARVIDSPQRPAGAGAPGGVSAPAATPNPITDDDTVAWNDVSSAMIAAPIEAKPVDLAGVTGGLVSGKSGVEVAALSVPEARRAADATVMPAGASPDSVSEATKAAEEAKKAADDAKRAADQAQKDADAAAKKAADEAKKASDDATKKAAEDAKKAADDAQKASDDAKKASDDAAKKAADDAKNAGDDAAKKAADEAKQAADDAKKAADDAARQADDAKKASDDAAKQAADDAAKKAADDANQAETDSKQLKDDGKSVKDAAPTKGKTGSVDGASRVD